MSSPLPLLRLPGVVLCEIFKSLSIEEKFKLSLCSKKVLIQINIARLYSQKVIVDLDMLYQNVRVHCENNKNSFTVFCCPVSRKGHNIRVSSENIRDSFIISIYHDFGKRHNFLAVIEHLLKMFYCKISSTIRHHNSDLYQQTISMLFDLQVEFKMLFIELNGSKDRILLWNQISKKLELVEDLVLVSGINTVTPVFASWPQNINIFSFVVFTLESLMECTCTRIKLYWSHWGNKDLEVILNNWKTGKLPNLTFLRVDSEITDNGATILGMSLRELNGLVIRSDDRTKKATIDTLFSSIEISVTPFE